MTRRWWGCPSSWWKPACRSATLVPAPVPPLVLTDGSVPRLQVLVGDQVPVLLGDEQPAGPLVGVDDGLVDPGLPHRLGRLELDLLDGRYVEEHAVARPRL